MKTTRFLGEKMRVALTPALLVLAMTREKCLGNPQGMIVVSGGAKSSQHGNTLQINTSSHNTFLQWSSFNIAPGETTIFNEPSASSVVFNNIKGTSASSIYGSLKANGIVVLENLNGFTFGPNATVKVGGLVLTTSAVNPWFSGGSEWSFDGPATAAPIVNYGTLEADQGGSIFIIGKDIDNEGTISAPGGKVSLMAGQEVLLSDRADGLSLAAPVKLPAGSINNNGQIVADAGQVLLQAETVNNNGVIQANSIRNDNGVIELYASQDLQLGSSSVIQANGDSTTESSGGVVTIKSGGTFGDATGSEISATGGASGGNGGNIEISSPSFQSLNSKIDASAQPGWKEGSFSFDPENIVLGNFSSGSTSAGTSGVIDATGSSGTVDVDVGSAFQNIDANILLEASGNITLNAGTIWDLSQTTGRTSGMLSLEAGQNITFGAANQAGAVIVDENDWSVSLQAGYDFSGNSGDVSGVTPGVGTVSFLSPRTGGGSTGIETAAGSIDVVAGNGVTLGNTGLITGVSGGQLMGSGGGNINIQAVSGNVNGGSSTIGYSFTTSGATANPTLGGIRTTSGGNVTIEAGGNVTAPAPGGTVSGNQVVSDYGVGAFGSSPGEVTITAGGNVTGHYVVTDGAGLISAGNNAGTPSANLSLSLVDGSWNVTALNDIYLQEARNPNGTFNVATGTAVRNPYYLRFDYGALDSVNLDANGVFITGSSPPRVSGNEPLIFPPTLDIEAGAGGINFEAPVNLFPSPLGGLSLKTTDGGNLQGSGLAGSPTLYTLNISDSTRTAYNDSAAFQENDSQQNNLLHLNDPNPAKIDISGSISDFTLYSSKPVQMAAQGNIEDSQAYIFNLRPTDVSQISAGGEILEQDQFTIQPLSSGQVPNTAALIEYSTPQVYDIYGDLVQNPNLIPVLAGLNLTYYPSSRTLLYYGIPLSSQQIAALESIHYLDASDLNAIYLQSQLNSLSSDNYQFQVFGPGTLKINASSINLGYGGGLISAGLASGGYTAAGLAPVTPRGAELDVTTTGGINIIASGIESQDGGTININCGGEIDVGSPVLSPNATTSGYLVGIVSLWDGDINVIADGNINVDGSRIATYDGGNIFVESLHGNVNAGVGGNGTAAVLKYFLDKEGNLESDTENIAGNGILATSFPQVIYGEPTGQIGNITVNTPQGDIIANRGGIVQVNLSPGTENKATIDLTAGTEANGVVQYVGNVDAGNSGVIGGQVNISATGDINGLVVASQGASVIAVQNVSATVLSQGNATVSAGGTVSGTIVGVGSVSVSGAADVAAAFSATGVSASGSVSGAAVAAAPTGSSSAAAAATTQQVNTSTQSNSAVSANDDENDDLKKKKKTLVEYVGRVTVLLPQ